MPRSPLYSDGGQAVPLMGEGATESGLNALAKTMSLVGQMTALRNSAEDQAKQNQMFTVQYEKALRANRMEAEAEAQQNALIALAKTESALLTGAADTPTTGEIKGYKDRGEQFLKKGPQFTMAAMLEFYDGATMLADQNGSKAALAFETAKRHNPNAWPAGHINSYIANQFNQSNPAMAMQALGENVDVEIPTIAGPNGPVRQKLGQVWETIFSPATSPEQVAGRVALADSETRKKIVARLDTIEPGRGQAVLAVLDKMKPVEQRSAEVQAIYTDAVTGSPARKLAAYQKTTQMDPQYLTGDQFGVLANARKRLEDTQITLAADNDGAPPKTVNIPELAKLVVGDMAKQIANPEYGGQANLAPYREPFAEIMKKEREGDKPGDVSRVLGWLAGFDADQEKRDTATRSARVNEMVGTLTRSGVTTVVDKNGAQSVIPKITDKDPIYADLLDMAKNLGRNPFDLGTSYITDKEAAAAKIAQMAGKEQVGTESSASFVTVQRAAVLGQLWDKIVSADKLRRTKGPQAPETSANPGAAGVKTDKNGLPVIPAPARPGDEISAQANAIKEKQKDGEASALVSRSSKESAVSRNVNYFQTLPDDQKPSYIEDLSTIADASATTTDGLYSKVQAAQTLANITQGKEKETWIKKAGIYSQGMQETTSMIVGNENKTRQNKVIADTSILAGGLLVGGAAGLAAKGIYMGTTWAIGTGVVGKTIGVGGTLVGGYYAAKGTEAASHMILDHGFGIDAQAVKDAHPYLYGMTNVLGGLANFGSVGKGITADFYAREWSALKSSGAGKFIMSKFATSGDEIVSKMKAGELSSDDIIRYADVNPKLAPVIDEMIASGKPVTKQMLEGLAKAGATPDEVSRLHAFAVAAGNKAIETGRSIKKTLVGLPANIRTEIAKQNLSSVAFDATDDLLKMKSIFGRDMPQVLDRLVKNGLTEEEVLMFQKAKINQQGLSKLAASGDLGGHIDGKKLIYSLSHALDKWWGQI